MKPTVLAYEIDDEKRWRQIRQIGRRLQVQVRRIRPEHYHVSLQQILQTPQSEWRSGPDTAELGAEMVVFCGLTDSLLERFLYELRRMGTVERKAVLTETNAAWTFYQLYEEIRNEHEKMEETGR